MGCKELNELEILIETSTEQKERLENVVSSSELQIDGHCRSTRAIDLLCDY